MGKKSRPPGSQGDFQRIVEAWPGSSSYQQRQRLLDAMLERGCVTTMEAVRFLEIVDPRPRIAELRAAGWHIVRSWTKQESETGGLHRVGLYRLKERLPGAVPISDIHVPTPQIQQASLFDIWL